MVDILTEVGSSQESRHFSDERFNQRLYTDCRKYAGLGSKIARTKKGDYQRCIDYIEAWNPSCGCVALREKADKNAKARLKARELGYAA